MKYHNLLLAFFLLLSACEKSIDQVEEYPLGEILSVNKTDDGLAIKVVGRGRSQGFYDILDTGIVWFESSELPLGPPLESASISLGRSLRSGEKFELEISQNLVVGRRYFIRMYSRIQSGVVYSPAQAIVF